MTSTADRPAVGRLVGWFVVCLALWMASSYATRWGPLSTHNVAIVSATGGIVAGVLVILDRSRWWVVLVPGAAALALLYSMLDLPPVLVAGRTAADLASCVVYAAVILTFRDSRSGLGAPVGWVALAAVAGAMTRLFPIVIAASVAQGSMPHYAPSALVEIGLGVVVGFVTLGSTVIGVTPWRPLWSALPLVPWTRRAGTGLVGLAVLVVYLTPLGDAAPGTEYLVILFVVMVAGWGSFELSALACSSAVLLIGASLSHGWGPFTGAAETDAVISTQVFMIVLTVATFGLASVVEQRRVQSTRAEDALEVQRTLFSETPTPVVLITHADPAGRHVLDVNDAFCTLVGRARSELVGARLADLFHVGDDQLLHLARSGSDILYRAGSDRVTWLRPSMSHVMRAADQPFEFTALALQDVTMSRLSEGLLREQARRDPLTGLGNRTSLVERLDGILSQRSVYDMSALIMLKLEGLGRVNTGAGADLGDALLQHVTHRLVETAGANASLCRASSSEFAVIVHDTSAVEAITLAGRLRRVLDEPFVVGDEQLVIGGRAGVVTDLHRRSSPAGVLRKAEIALERAKQGHRDVAVFEDGDDTTASQTHALEHLLRTAVAQDSLHAVFQPIVSLADGHVVSAEALVRLKDPAGKLVAPNRFLPLAAEMGLMGSLSRQMLTRAVFAAAEWSARGHPVSVAFNAPPSWLNSDSVAFITGALAAHGLDASSLTVEVTEEEMMVLAPEGVSALKTLRAEGCHVAIDDFGTGYAGLSSFRGVPADIVKIDRSFVSASTATPEDRVMLGSMIDLIHRFGKLAVAEGVETQDQLEVLRNLGCDRIQGFLFSPPVDFSSVPMGDALAHLVHDDRHGPAEATSGSSPTELSSASAR